MKLSISNIAWTSDNDEVIYMLMRKYGFCGLEIAPTRIVQERPYDNISKAITWKQWIEDSYKFDISSIQSIWYGINEKLFGSDEERLFLDEYTRKAIDFAASLNCGNLVFGCPQNRNMPYGADETIAECFFKEMGNYAFLRGTTIGMEANPQIYKTNYINDTMSAIKLIGRVNSPGFLLNLDIGTMIVNDEDIGCLEGNVQLINHVHISEPGLEPILSRNIHRDLCKLLKNEDYNRYISIEMSKGCDVYMIEKKMEYVRSVFE